METGFDVGVVNVADGCLFVSCSISEKASATEERAVSE